MKFTKELIEKAKSCRTAEELLALAKENEIELTKEDAEVLLEEFGECELADEELDNVAGGAEGCESPNTYSDVYWDRAEDVQFIFNVGDTVYVYSRFTPDHTIPCDVLDREADKCDNGKYTDYYYIAKKPGVRVPFGSKRWVRRHFIVR